METFVLDRAQFLKWYTYFTLCFYSFSRVFGFISIFQIKLTRHMTKMPLGPTGPANQLVRLDQPTWLGPTGPIRPLSLATNPNPNFFCSCDSPFASTVAGCLRPTPAVLDLAVVAIDAPHDTDAFYPRRFGREDSSCSPSPPYLN
jgi:hypothetical protein